MVDINTVGAGGGSIAWFDRDGLLKVGPSSAGADAGPGLLRPRRQRADRDRRELLLGRLSPKRPDRRPHADGLGAARRAFTPIAERLGFRSSEPRTACSASSPPTWCGAIRTVSVERGNDPRDFTLMPFGGAGPLHASEVARSLGMREILVPAAPGILCAQGLIVSDLKEDFVRTIRARARARRPRRLPGLSRACGGSGAAGSQREGVAAGATQRSKLTLDMRYVGQNFELPVPIGTAKAADAETDRRGGAAGAVLRGARPGYGFHNADDPIEIVNVRLSASAALSRDRDRAAGSGHGARSRSGTAGLVRRRARPVRHAGL